MLSTVFEFARPLLFALDPEQAHEFTLKSLEAGVYPRPSHRDDPRLGVKIWDIAFPNPFGIASGFDKDARVPDAVIGMGFGHAEIGTVTPLAQTGNPKPRIFRLIRDKALVNRLGFNNGGHAAALERLRARPRVGVVGINVGANKDALDRAADYETGIAAFYDVASYFTINISSPNTPGLRDLQAPAALDDLLARVLAARERSMAAGKPKRPIVVKLAPDIAEADLEPVVAVLLRRDVDGIAVSNTTLARSGLTDAGGARESGGLSGRPLFHRSTVVLARVRQITEGRVPLIGIGGIDSGTAAIAKLEAGAALLQLYTGLVYEGPSLLGRMKRDILSLLERENIGSIGELTGRRTSEWAARNLEA